jgi:hydrogenase nickel incorporation protein HypB
MCDVCGCSSEHFHPDGDHAHAPGVTQPRGLRSVRVEADLTAKNDRIAAHNRGWFEGRSMLALNLVSSPGAGKTTLIERTLRDLAAECSWAVIEGDQQTDNDARRIAACGVPVVEINTGAVCHLDAQMVRDACRTLASPAGTVTLIENVGNLVCPALFDLGESAKVVVASVAEGDDKPEKYPYMFQAASLVVLNKLDLLPYVAFDADRFEQIAHQVNPDARVIRVSATRGDNLEEWYDWLRERRAVNAMADNP